MVQPTHDDADENKANIQLSALTEADKENERQDKTTTSKKWYDGKVTKPVVFRTTSNRFNENR